MYYDINSTFKCEAFLVVIVGRMSPAAVLQHKSSLYHYKVIENFYPGHRVEGNKVAQKYWNGGKPLL